MKKQYLMVMLYIFLSLIGVMVIAAVLFISFNPSFGAKPSGSRLTKMEQVPNYNEGRFDNVPTVKVDFSFAEFRKILAKTIKGNPNGSPKSALPAKSWSNQEIMALADTSVTAIWYGHSAFYLKMDGLHVLIDPMFGDYPAPAPYLISKRYDYTPPLQIAELPEIDVIIISHDHYDHLDYGSIKMLNKRTKQFLVPLGVGAHLEAWGVSSDKITELYWQESVKVGDIQFTCTPAQHFSGRGLSDKMHTLWSSWVISGSQNLFFSGDSGYFAGFKAIGEEHGPFDFAFMECGQYDELWPDIHMFPEETAQAALDVKAEKFMPIHWGAFKLANHSWDDSINRVVKAADSLGIDVITPQIGEAIVISQGDLSFDAWWTAID